LAQFAEQLNAFFPGSPPFTDAGEYGGAPRFIVDDHVRIAMPRFSELPR
jgi:hypothetical protein